MEKLKLDALRRRAEAILESSHKAFPENTDNELRNALHELHTYQIELEMQNEELRRVQEDLMETRDQYIDLYDFAPVGYFTLNNKNLIMEANLTMAGLLGEERKALLGHRFSQFIVPEDQDIFYKHFRELIASPNQRTCELRLRRKNGDQFPARLECVPKVKRKTNEISIRIALHDITEAKRVEAEFMTAKKLEATALLAGGIAHDFNNLLTIILGNLEIAEDELRNGRSISGQLKNAQEACLDAADLTQKFLTFSSGGEPFKKNLPAEALITDSVKLALAGSNINVDYSFPDGLYSINVDAGQITRAIGNVIINAREAMPQGGVIRVRAENVDSVPEKDRQVTSDQNLKYVKISFEDQGTGIPEDILPQVFDPYFSSQEMGVKKGLGMGLTIAYSITQKHGGFIDIASQQHIGTTVSMYLPASDKPIIPPALKPRKKIPFHKKILVMDDEEMLREITSYWLEELGYKVETACNGEEAIQIYSREKQAGSPFGAVILDLTIKGGMGGGETIKRLKEVDPDIRAIVVSGYSTDPIIANFKEYGFSDAISKPYLSEDLEKSLENIADDTTDR